MSTNKNVRKRGKANYNKSTAAKKKVKTEVVFEDKQNSVEGKQVTLGSDKELFYPCQYCGKIFSQRISNINHTKKCRLEKVEPTLLLNQNKSVTNNNNVEQNKLPIDDDDDFNSNGSSNAENKYPEYKSHIPSQINTPKDTSIYDYDEQDESSEENNSKENNEEVSNNRQCKHCSTAFDNPLDLLRHTRDCHSFPKTILPLEEIEKYFDYPNREFCPICEKPIKTRNLRSVFIKHLLVHQTGLTHECGICKKKFRRRDHMRAHEKRHIVSV